MNNFTESEIEIFSLDELKQLGFSYIPGPSIAPDVDEAMQQSALPVAESFAPYGILEKRASYSEVVLRPILEQAIHRLNPTIPETARLEALKAVLAVFSP